MAVDYGPSVDISDIEDIPVTEEHNNVGGKVMDNNMQNMMVITFKKWSIAHKDVDYQNYHEKGHRTRRSHICTKHSEYASSTPWYVLYV